MTSYSAPKEKAKAILSIAAWWPEGTHVGGVFIREHVEAVADHYQMIVVHGIVNKGNSLWPSIRISSSIENGIPVHRIKIHTWLRRFGMAAYLIRRSYRKVIDKLARQYDLRLMHIHVRTDETEQAKAIARDLDLPIVITEHNTFYNLGLATLEAKSREQKRKAVHDWFDDRRIHKVMPVSEDLANTLKEVFGVSENKIRVIPNIAAPMFKPVPHPATGRFQLMLAAYWRPVKDHNVFIDALKLMPNNLVDHCTIIWGGTGPSMDHIRERCEKELPNVDIRFTGHLEKEAMAEFMQSSDVFLLPTTCENLPCVIAESLSCGTPVISMKLNGIPEMVNEYNGILVPPRAANELAEAITTVMRSPERFNRSSIASNAQKRYSVEAVADQILEVYNEVLLEHRSG